MKIASFRARRQVNIGGVRYGKGDEKVLSTLLNDSQKLRLAELGVVTLVPASTKKAKKDDVKLDSESVET